MEKEGLIFSIIIPTRNRASLLMRCLQSIIEQSFENWEVLIIDDGSIDTTRSLVMGIEDRRIKYYFKEHGERSSARNLGISLAVGKYICFIDDDDYVKKAYLEDFYAYYEENNFPEIILRTGFVRYDGHNSCASTNYEIKKHGNTVNFIMYNMCGIGSLAIPTSFLGEDRFPEGFPHWQDTHLFARLLMKVEMVQLDSHNYVYVIHDQMGSKKAVKDFDPLSRAILNVKAIKDLFEKEEERIYQFVTKDTLRYLSAEKYLQYALNVVKDNRRIGRILFQNSINEGFFRRLSKEYISFFIKYAVGIKK